MITGRINKPLLYLFLLVLMTASCQSAAQQETSFKDLTVSEFEAKMAEEGVVILDVRTPGETAEGMIEGAKEIDFRGEDFQAQLEELDKDATYVVYCRSGGRSASACSMMQEMGFKDVYNLVGGYQRWSAEH